MSSRISVQPIEEFLQHKLQEQALALSLTTSEDTLWYVGTMLTTFTQSKQLFVYDKGRTVLPTLAFLWRDANAAISEHDRISLLRKLGDTALFVGSLFPESFTRKGIRKDYFVGMGGGAYASLADASLPQKRIYSELAVQFPVYMQLVAAVCAKELAFDAQDIIALYDRWCGSKSLMLERQLAVLGVTLSDSGSTRH